MGSEQARKEYLDLFTKIQALARATGQRSRQTNPEGSVMALSALKAPKSLSMPPEAR